MDLSSLSVSSEDGANLELKDPLGEPILKPDGTPVTIKLQGSESAKWKKARNVAGNRYLQMANPRNAAQAKTMDELIGDLAFQLASVTLSWDGIVDESQEIECNLASAKKLYLKYDWLREQVEAFVNERRNFWKASLKN
jgi:hypothetical protein